MRKRQMNIFLSSCLLLSSLVTVTNQQQNAQFLGPLLPKQANQTNEEQNYPIKDIKVGDFIDRVTLKSGENNFYKLIIDESTFKDEDLVVKVIPLDQNSDPDIYISKTEKYPSSPLTSDWQCSSYGKDTCTVNNRNLTKGSSLYIGISCIVSECTYQMKVLLTSEFPLEDGIEFQTYLYKEDTRVFRFTIPPQISDSTSITVKASAYRGSVHDFSLSVSSGDKLGTGFTSKTGVSAWKKGQVVRLNKDNFAGWCKGCEIKVLLDVKDSGYYHIMAQTTDSTPLLQNFNQVDDIVDFDQIQCYKYFVAREESNFQIQFITYSGKIQFKANPEVLPTNWTNFKIQGDSSDDVTEGIIDLRPWVRRWAGQKLTGLYYLCVKGELTSSYSFKIKEFIQNTSNPIELEDGFSEYFHTRGNGKMQLFTYKVPKLEYKGEDIKVEVTLAVKRGNAENVLMAGKLCEVEKIQMCTETLTSTMVFSKKSTYQKAQKIIGGSLQKLVIDHDEALCENMLHGECVYIIAIVNNNGIVGNPSGSQSESQQRGNGIRYKLQATHTQNNHEVLSEGTQITDSVNIKSYKYYKFTILEDDSKLKNVTFEISPMHGDCDLLISRNESNMFPTKLFNDKISQRIGSLVDHIEYTKEDYNNITSNTTVRGLNGTYYVGVYGYTFTTFSILVTVHRKNEAGYRTKMTEIYDGFPFSKRLHNELDMFFGYFKVDINEKDEHAIIIDIQNTEGKTNTYVKFGQMPDIINYEIKKQGEGVIIINPNDPHYHKQGTYYVTVVADFNFLDLFRDNYYTFSLSWRTQDTMPHLNPQRIQSISTNGGQYSYFRHFVQDTTDDIRISLMSKSGSQDLYVSLGLTASGGRNPNSTSYDFTSKFMKGGNYMNAKALLLPIALLQNTNSACKDFGYTEEEACVLYIGVYCSETTKCEGEIELDYESKTPKRIYSGQTKHQIMQSSSLNYYYLTVNEDSVGDIVAVLTNLVSDADLYVQIQNLNKTQLSTPPTGGTDGYLSWQLPNEANNTYQSKTKLNTEMISIPRKEIIKQCGFVDTKLASMTASGPKKRNPSEIKECMLVFGIIPAKELRTSQQDNEVHYNFAVYQDFMILQQQIPTTGEVKEGNFAYFLYKEECSNYTILISLVSQGSSGDSEIYINKGLTLPTKTEYNLKRSTLHSEVIALNLEETDFLKNETTMQGHYLIGVYSSKNTTFQISVSSSEEPVTQLTDGVIIKHQQKPYSIVYFQYYHFLEDTDITIDLHVFQGASDLYVTTFNSTSEDFVQKLPKRKSDAKWISEDVNSINSGSDDKQVLIMQNDRNYCVDCYYVIGIVTHESQCTYHLSLNSGQEEDSANFLRVGMSKSVKLDQSDKIQRYQFMLDSKENARIVPTLLTGEIRVSISFGSLNESFLVHESPKPAKIKPFKIKHENLVTEKNYFAYVECLSESCDLTLLLEQEKTIVQLSDGHPQQLFYEDFQDVSKYLIYNLPKGNSTVVFFVKSKTQNFFPQLYLSVQEKDSTPIFPPDEAIGYEQFYDWDHDLYAMKVSFDYLDQADGAFLAINLKYKMENKAQSISEVANTEDTKGTAQITVSHTKITKLAEGEDYFGDLGSNLGGQLPYRFHIFKLSNPMNRTMKITYSMCIGQVNVGLIYEPGNLDERVPIEFKKDFGNYVGTITDDLDGEFYLLVETNQISSKNEEPTEYIVRVDFYDKGLMHKVMLTNYVAEDGGAIRVDYPREMKGNVKLNWSPLYMMNFFDPQASKVAEGVRYKLVFSENSDAVMDSVCAIKRYGIAQSKVFTIYEDVDGDNEFMAQLPRGVDTQFNVIAIVESTQQAIPYKPINLRVPDRPAYGGHLFIQLLFAAIILFAFLALYFFCRNRKLQARLHEEIREIGGQGGQNQSYRRVKEEVVQNE